MLKNDKKIVKNHKKHLFVNKLLTILCKKTKKRRSRNYGIEKNTKKNKKSLDKFAKMWYN